MITIALLFAASIAEQMAPAKQGMQQCQMPDVLFKTCFSLSKVYQVNSSIWVFESETLVDPHSKVVASIKDSVFARGSELCKAANAMDVAKATFSLDGRPVAAADAAKYRAKLKRYYGLFAGKMICTQVVHNDQDMELVQATVDGKHFNIGDYAMKWVNPSDGWKVAP